MAPSTPVPTSAAKAAMSTNEEIPPLAITGFEVAAHTDCKSSKLGQATFSVKETTQISSNYSCT